LFQDPSEQMQFVSAMPESRSSPILQARGNRRAHHLHGAHQGVPSEHKETRNGNQKKKIRLAVPSSYSTHTQLSLSVPKYHKQIHERWLGWRPRGSHRGARARVGCNK
jgi:hypothetical protein